MRDIERPSDSPVGHYDLTDEEMTHRVRKLLERREPSGSDTRICYMLDDRNIEDREFTDIARTTECHVFREAFRHTPAEMRKLYGAYDDADQSVFFVAVDKERGAVAGVFRVIRDGPNGFKTLEDLAVLRQDPEYIQRVYNHYNIKYPAECWDLATAAVPRQFQGTSPLIYRAFIVASQRMGIKHFFSVIDEKPFATVQFLGFPFMPLYQADWMEYANSAKSLPVYGEAEKFEASIRAREQQVLQQDKVLGAVARAAFNQVGRGTNDSALQF